MSGYGKAQHVPTIASHGHFVPFIGLLPVRLCKPMGVSGPGIRWAVLRLSARSALLALVYPFVLRVLLLSVLLCFLLSANLKGDKIMERYVKLQGIGYYRADFARNLTAGRVCVWNYGYTSRVLSITPSPTGKTVVLRLQSGENGKITDRRLGADTLVAIV